MVSGYRKTFVPEEAWREQRVLLTIEAAGHQAEVFLNGEKLAEHFGGYTAFSVNLSPLLVFGEENILVVKVDSRASIVSTANSPRSFLSFTVRTISSTQAAAAPANSFISMEKPPKSAILNIVAFPLSNSKSN